MTLFRQMLNTFGVYIAFGPLVYFTITMFTASFYKSMLAFGAVFAIGHYLLDQINRKMVKIDGKAVLITGCDTGFGNIAARRLAKQGLVVFAGCLNAKNAEADLKLDDNNNESEQSSDSEHKPRRGKIIRVQLDVTRDDQVAAARDFVEKSLIEHNLKLWAVVNNAGLGLACEAEMTSMATCQRVMDVNFLGVVRVTNAFIPLLRHAKGSRIVNMSSILGLGGVPTSGVYSASKAGVLHWGESLRIELLKFDIQVCAICPDFYLTPMTSRENIIKGFDGEVARLPQKVREAYGDEYLDFQRNFILNKDKVVQTNPDTSPVVDIICDCVLRYRPRPVNIPIAWYSRLLLNIMSSWATPQILSDWLLMTLSQQDAVPVAWAARQPQVDEDGEETHGYH